MASERIYGDLIVDGASTWSGDVTWGKSTTTGTARTITLAGTETNIGVDFILKGSGLLLVPSGYESNIGSEGRALVNKSHHDTNIAGLSTAISAPGADRILFYDHSGTAFDWLELNGLEVSGTQLSVTANTTVQKVAVRADSASEIGTRRRINFISGSSIAITVADDSTNDEINVTIDAEGGGSGSVAFGTTRQIPFMNAGANNFSYSSGTFEWFDTKRYLVAGSSLTLSEPTFGFSVLVGTSITIANNWSYSAVFGELHNISGGFGDSIIAGHSLNKSGGGMGGQAIFGIQHTISGAGSKQNDLLAGQGHTYNTSTGSSDSANTMIGSANTISGTTINFAFVSGRRSHGLATAAFVHGYPISDQSTRPIIASALNAFNVSANSSSQTSGHGALANYCAILGGQDHNIPSDSPGSVILGGNAIKARAATSNEVYVTGLTLAAGALTGLNVAAPSVITDSFRMYATDITAGNSAPHFKTENGDVIRLYADSGWTKMTGTPQKGTFATGTVTLAELAGKVMALEAVLFDNIGILKA